MSNNCTFQMWIRATTPEQMKALEEIERSAETIQGVEAAPWFFGTVYEFSGIELEHDTLALEGTCANSMRNTIFAYDFEKLVREKGLWVEAFSEEPASEVQEHFVYEAGERTVADERAWGIYDLEELRRDPVEMSRICNIYKCSPDYIMSGYADRNGFGDVILGGYGIWEPRCIDAKLSAREDIAIDEGRTYFQLRAFGEDGKLEALGDKIARYPYFSEVQNVEFEHVVNGQLDVSGEIDHGGVRELLDRTPFLDDLREAGAVADIQSLGTRFYTRDHYVVSGDKDVVFHERDYGFPMLDESRARAAIARAAKGNEIAQGEPRATRTLKAIAEQVMNQDQDMTNDIATKERDGR